MRRRGSPRSNWHLGIADVEADCPSREVPAPAPPSAPARPDGLIEIVLPGGVLVRVDAACRWRSAAPGSGRAGGSMIALASGLRVYLACGVTDMRKGMTGLAMLVQQTLGRGSVRRRGVRLSRAPRRADQADLA